VVRWSLRCLRPLHNDIRVLDEVRHGALPTDDKEPGDPGWASRRLVLCPQVAEADSLAVDRQVLLAVFGLGHLAIRYYDVPTQAGAGGPKAASPTSAAAGFHAAPAAAVVALATAATVPNWQHIVWGTVESVICW